MSLQHESANLDEKHANAAPAYEPATLGEHTRGRPLSSDPEDAAIVVADQNQLHRDLKGRHMQMIAMQVQHIELSSVY
jgi:amino acid transporter